MAVPPPSYVFWCDFELTQGGKCYRMLVSLIAVVWHAAVAVTYMSAGVLTN